MWTAKLESKSRDVDAIKIVVAFSNGTPEDGFTKVYRISPSVGVEGFKLRVKRFIDDLNKIDTDLDTFVQGDVPDPSPVSETPEEIAKKEYIDDLQIHRQILKGIELGIFDGTETQAVNIKAKVKDNFIPAYLTLL